MDMFSYVLTFVEGILTFISPCILPMLPIYFLYLAGTAAEDGGSTPQPEPGKSRIILNALGFVLGFTAVFVLLGAAATSLGGFLSGHKDIIRKISGIIMIIFGLNFLGVFKLKFLNVEKRINYKFKKLRFFSSVLFGAVFGFGWSPCIGAFLGSALALAGSSGTILRGMTLLLIYSVGLGIPFLITSIIFDKARGFLKKIQRFSAVINIASGILLIIAGVLVYFDVIKYLSIYRR